MISEYENYAVQAMLGYYNHDYEMFFRYLDEGVIWYGPKEGQYIVGKDNLIAQVKKYESKIIFQVDSVESKLVSFSSNVYTLLLSYRLNSCYPDGRVKTCLQRVTVNGQKCRDQDGKIFWRCPLIQVSNVIQNKANGSPEDTTEPYVHIGFNEPEKESARVILPGDNNSTIYVKEDSIRYIAGGKGVFCYVYTVDNVYRVRMLLKDVINKLPDFYYRCHSSYIVNLKKVLYLSSSKITLYDMTEVPVSTKKYQQIKSDINNWMCGQ